MTQQIKITNSQESVIIDIEGTIGVPEKWQFDEPQQRVATYETFRNSLQQIETLDSPEVIVNIRSTGGDVNDALLIYDALTSLNATITTRCYGYVASAATVIAQAASEGLREISSNALYLVHNSQCSIEGTAQELSQRMELLEKTDERLSQLYAERSGGEAERFRTLMSEQNGAGRWLNAQETIELSLADKLIDVSGVEPSAEELQQQSESFIEKTLKQVSNVVNRLGKQIKTDLFTQSEGQQMQPKMQEMTPAKMPSVQCSGESRQSVETYNKSSQIALEEGQKNFAKSEVVQHEDPTLNEAKRSANTMAYDNDARRLLR